MLEMDEQTCKLCYAIQSLLMEKQNSEKAITNGNISNKQVVSTAVHETIIIAMGWLARWERLSLKIFVNIVKHLWHVCRWGCSEHRIIMQTQRIHSFLEHLSGSVAVVSVQLLDKPSTNPPLHFITACYSLLVWQMFRNWWESIF